MNDDVVVVAGADAHDGRARAFTAARMHAVVVLTGRDAGALGTLATAVRAEAGTTARVAVYVGAPEDDALAEMIGELFATGSG